MNRRSSPKGCFWLFALLGALIGVYLVQHHTGASPEPATPQALTTELSPATPQSVSMALDVVPASANAPDDFVSSSYAERSIVVMQRV